MKIVIGIWVALSLGVAAMLAGCGGDGSSSGTPAVGSVAARHVARSWMAPNTSSENLLYTTEACGGICVFSYPGGTLVGELADSNYPLGECVDKSGDVFVVDFGADGGTAGIVEYAHGGTSPIATLSDPGYYPEACSIDPTTGNLAVTSDSSGSGTGIVAIYAEAKGDPTDYVDPKIFYMGSCGYDDKGNLFVDGQYDHQGTFELDEMLEGSNKFKKIKLTQAPGSPLKLQWAGKYVALAASNTVIDHVAVTGSKGTVVGTTLLNGPVSGEGQFWIQGNTVIAPYEPGTGSAEVGFWKYPTGGRVRKNIGGTEFNYGEPFGTAVSLAQQ